VRWSRVGKASTPAPQGRFWIPERFKIDDPQSGYRAYAFGTSVYSTLTDWPAVASWASMAPITSRG